MPDYSGSRRVALNCVCGATVETEHWDVIDESARRDLVAALAAGGLGRVRCPRCGRILYDEAPVAVIRSVHDGRIAIVFSAEPDRPDTRAVGDELAAMLPSGIYVIHLPFDVTSVILERDLARDGDEIDTAVQQVELHHGRRAAEQYRELLVSLVHRRDVEAAEQILEFLGSVGDSRAFADLLTRHPDLLGQDKLEMLERAQSMMPELAPMLEAIGLLLRAARTDPQTAWGSYAASFTTLQPSIDELQRLAHERRFDEMIARGGQAILDAAPSQAREINDFVADALLETSTGDHAENVELALDHRRRAVDLSSNDQERAVGLMNLAVTYGKRIFHDPRSNLEEALVALREAHTLVSGRRDSDPHLLAYIQLNLANVLEQRVCGNRGDNLREARAMCRASLRWRTPERNAVDWAYGQVDLGNIVEKMDDIGQGTAREAQRAYEAVIERADQVSDSRVLGVAYSNLAGIHRAKALKTRWRSRKRRHLQQARQGYEHALRLFEGVDRGLQGRTLNLLADLHELRGDEQAVLDAARAASAILSPTLAPAEAERAASRLGWQLAERGDWMDAADAYSKALDAADLTYYFRALAVDRATEQENRSTLNRWAAYALARAGRLRDAALALENGRMRELRRRFPPPEDDLRRLQDASPQLYARYVRALGDLAHATLADDADASARRHQQALERIRALPGFEGFASTVDWAVLAAATTAACPLIYVDPTPFGTLVLVVAYDSSGAPDARASFLDVTSTEVVERLMMATGLSRGREVRASYLTAIITGDHYHVALALDLNLSLFGERFAAPIDRELRVLGASAATLVVVGPLALFPLHATNWRENGSIRTLSDRYAITFAPSATAQAASVQAASAPQPPRAFVALGEPRPDVEPLPAARAEVEYIASQFPLDARTVAFGAEATTEFLIEHAARATHLHLACHARGVALDFRETSLELADADLPLTRIAALGRLRARLAVISACETGVTDIASEEAYSIGAVLLACGAAAAVVSLWRVEDYASALLMIRLYEELAAMGEPAPGEALRRAQRWLSNLTPREHEAYVSAHPELEAESARHLASREATAASLLTDSGRTPEGPFAHPRYWAGFVVMGV